MARTMATCAALLFLLTVQAGAVTAILEDFDGIYSGGPIGSMPLYWTYSGFGSPAHSREVDVGVDGKAWRIDVPGSAFTSTPATIAIYRSSYSLDAHAVAGQPIDWTQPVYLKADVYGADYGTDTMWKATLDMQNYTRTNGAYQFDRTLAWHTLTTTIDPGQSGQSGNLVLVLDFQGPSFGGSDILFWDNLRMEYSAVPEPCSLLAVVMGLAGLGVVRKRQ